MNELLSTQNTIDWDAFVDSSTSLWLWHRTDWADYCEAYGTRRGSGWLERDDAGAVTRVHPEWPTLEGDHLVLPLSTDMWADIRKGHQAAIRASLNRGLINVRYGWFDEYADLHKRVFGADARAPQTYEIQQRLVQQGQGFVVVSEDTQHLRAAALFYRYKDGAYYASAPRCQEHPDEPSGAHALMWVAMVNLLQLGTRWLDLGPVPGPLPSEKDLSIYGFKKGFGGEVRRTP